jgi:hypothetical protein
MGAGRLLITASTCALALSIVMPVAATGPVAAVGLETSEAAPRDVRSAANALRRAKTAQRRARRADKRAKQALKVARRLVTSAKILDGAVTAADIADGAVQASEIATDAVGAAEIAPDAVGSSELAANAVTSAEILSATIVGGPGGDIAPDTITAGELAPDAVGAGELAPGAVTAADISADSIAIDDIAQSVWSSAHAAGTLAGRPAASSSNDGFLYFATDDNGGTLYRSNGSSWVKAAPGLSQAQGTPESITMVGPDVANVTWSAMPSALTEFNSSARYRTKYDLSNANQVRLVARVQVGGAGGAELRAQYSTDESTWNYLDGGSGPAVNVGTSGTNVSTPWSDLAAAAKGDVFLRVVGLNGSGTDATFGQISIQIRQ